VVVATVPAFRLAPQKDWEVNTLPAVEILERLEGIQKEFNSANLTGKRFLLQTLYTGRCSGVEKLQKTQVMLNPFLSLRALWMHRGANRCRFYCST